MASFNDLINKVKEYQKSLDAASGNSDALADVTKDMLQTLHDGLEKITKKSKEAGNALKEDLNKGAEAGKKTSDSINDINTSLNKVKQTSKDVDNLTQNLNKSVDETSTHIKESTAEMEKFKNAAIASVSALKSGNLGSIISPLSPMLGKMAGAMQDIYDRSRRLNKSFLEFSGATESFSKAANQASKYRATINSVALSMGLTLEQTHAYTKTMQESGFSMEKITKQTDIAGTKMMHLKAVQAASISIGASFGDTNQFLSKSMLYLGKTADQAVKGVVNIGVAARGAGVSAKILMPIIRGLQDQFEYLGMKAIKTTNLVASAGLGSKNAAADITVMGKAVSGMLTMSGGAKAFFAQTGGLAGAKGKGAIGSVMAFEKAIAGIGGASPDDAFGSIRKGISTATGGTGIVGQSEAYADNASRATENKFYMQRELVKKNMGVGEHEAGRLLEIMSRMERGEGTKKDTKDLKKAMQDVGKDQTHWTRLTYQSTDAIATKIGLSLDRHADKLTPLLGPNGILGVNQNIFSLIAKLGTIGVAGNLLGKAMGGKGDSLTRGLFSSGKSSLGKSVSNLGKSALGRIGVPLAVGIGAYSAYSGAKAEGASTGQATVRGAGSGIGAGAGAALGAILGGPVGMVIGAYVGQKAGEFLGKTISNHMRGTKILSKAEEDRLKVLEKLVATQSQMSATEVEELNKLSSVKDVMNSKFEKYQEDELNYLENKIEKTKEEKKQLAELKKQQKHFNAIEKARNDSEKVSGFSLKKWINSLGMKGSAAAEEHTSSQIDTTTKLIAIRKKEYEELKGAPELQKKVTNQLQLFEKTLAQLNLKQSISKLRGGSAENITEIQKMLHGGSFGSDYMKKNNIGKSNIEAYFGGDMTALGNMNMEQMGEMQAKAATFKPAKISKDITQVDSPGVGFFSKGDIAIDKESLANIMSGDKGSAFPNFLKTAISSLPTGRMGNSGGSEVGTVLSQGGGGILGPEGRQNGATGGSSEVTVNIKGEGIFEKIINEQVKLNVKNGVIVGTQKTMQEVGSY